MNATAAAFLMTLVDTIPGMQAGALLIWPALIAEIGEGGCDLIRAAVQARGMQLVDDGAGFFRLAA
jgi:hypothetical protein